MASRSAARRRTPRSRASDGLAQVLLLVGESRSAATDAPVERYFGRGPFEAVQDTVAVTPCGCSISDRGLTALARAPVFKESSAATSRGSEPSPMTLSRYDEWSGMYPPPHTNRNSKYGLYAFADPSTPYPRAFWHPGIGIWSRHLARDLGLDLSPTSRCLVHRFLRPLEAR